MAAANRRSNARRTKGRHRRQPRDTDRVVRWLQAGAVAAGVGAAVVNGQGIASATTDADTSPPDTSAPAGQDAGTTTGSAPSTSSPSTQQDNAADDQKTPTTTPSSSSQADTVSAGDSPKTTVSAQTTVSSSQSDDQTDPTPGHTTAKATDSHKTRATNRAKPAVTPRLAKTPESASTATGSTTFSASARVATANDADTTAFAAVNTASTPVLRPPTATATVTKVDPPQTTQVRPLHNLVLGVLGLFGFSPNSPTPNPLLDAVWGLYRRVESTFDNQRPTVSGATITNSQLTNDGKVIVTGAVDFDDVDGDPLHYTSTDGAHGTVAVSPDGTFTYVPTDPGYTGTDTFTVTASDAGAHLHGLFGLFSPGGGHTRTATVSLTLTADNAAPVTTNDGYTVNEDATLNTAAPGVLTNDADANADPLVAQLVTGPAHAASFTLNPNGSFSYTPVANYAGPDSFTYKASDGAATSSTATVSLTVSPVNDAPTAGDDTNTVAEDGAGVSGNVLTNDTDIDSTGLTVKDPGTTVTTKGTLVLNANGSYTYTPKANANGTDVFTYTVTDNHPTDPRTDTATLTITISAVNDAPVIDKVTSDPGIGNSWTVSVDTTDPDGDDVTVTVNPVDTNHVTITTTPDGYVVTVTDADWAKANPGKQLSVVVSATDGTANATPKTVVVGTVNNVVALGANSAGQLDIPALPAGVTYTQVSVGARNTVLLRSDGTVVATPITDGSVEFGQSTIPALPPGLTYTQVAAGAAHTVLLRSDGTVVATAITGSEYDFGQTNIPALPPGLTYTQVAAGDFHTVLLRSDGQVFAVGEDDFGQTNIPALPAGVTYTQVVAAGSRTVLLRSDGTAVAVGLGISGQNNIPILPTGIRYTQIAAGGIHTVLLRSDGTAIAIGSNSSGQSNIPDLPAGLTYTQIYAGGHSTVLLRSDGVVASAGSIGVGQLTLPALPAGVTYTQAAASNGNVALLSAVVAAPSAGDDAVSTDEDTPLVIAPNTLLANDSDPNGDPLRISAVWGAGHGSTALGADGTITYTPAANYHGTDTFSYTASDGTLGDAATVTVTIASVNDAPTITAVDPHPGTGNTWTVGVTTNDPDGDDVTATVTPVDTGHVTVTGSGTDEDPFTVTVTDADWAKANPGKQLSVVVSATDGTADATPVTLVVGTVNNVVAIGSNAQGQRDIPALPAGVTYIQVATGGLHTVLLRSDGTAVAVGLNDHGQLLIPSPPAGVTYTQVAAGARHTVLLQSDGTVIAIGDNAAGQLNIPGLPAGVTYTQVAAGNAHTVLLRSDGNVVAFGDNVFGEVAIPALPADVTYTQVAAGNVHTVLLRSDGSAVAIGANNAGQLNIPAPPPGVTYTGVAAGGNHTVLLRSDGNAVAVGLDTNGQTDIPDLEEGVTYTRVAAGTNHTVLLRSDGTAVAIGFNTSGQTDVSDPPAGVAYTQISARGAVTVLLAAVDVAPSAGADTVAATEDTPVTIAPNTLLGNDSDPDGDPLTINAVWGAAHGTASLGADGKITYTPNANYNGQDTFSYLAYDGALGKAASVTVNIAAVDDAPVINSVTSTPGRGNSWTVTVDAVDPDGTPVSIDVEPTNPFNFSVSPDNGQPGTFVITANTGVQAPPPNSGVSVSVLVLSGDKAVTTTKDIGIVNDVLATGSNNSGQLSIPALPAGVTYTKAAVGGGHIVLLRSDGTVVATGSNIYGQRNIPTLPPGVTYTDVAAGVGHTVLLRSDGQVVQLGNPPGLAAIPDLPPGLTYTAIAAYGNSTGLLRSDNKAYGSNGLSSWYSAPAGVTWTDIAIGFGHIVMLGSNGSVTALGNNNAGQTNIPGLPAGVTYTQIAAGKYHTVLLRSDGNVVIAGGHFEGQPSPYGEVTVPPLPAGMTYVMVSASEYDTVLLRSDGTVFAFGRNQGGQNVIPVAAPGTGYVGVAAGTSNNVIFTGPGVVDDEV